MSFIKVLKRAYDSRVCGGLILQPMPEPFLKEELKGLIDLINEGKGYKTYYHLNEETCELTKFTKNPDGSYNAKVERTVTNKVLHKIQLRYEELKGLDLNSLHGRYPTWGTSEHLVSFS